MWCATTVERSYEPILSVLRMSCPPFRCGGCGRVQAHSLLAALQPPDSRTPRPLALTKARGCARRGCRGRQAPHAKSSPFQLPARPDELGHILQGRRRAERAAGRSEAIRGVGRRSLGAGGLGSAPHSGAPPPRPGPAVASHILPSVRGRAAEPQPRLRPCATPGCAAGARSRCAGRRGKRWKGAADPGPIRRRALFWPGRRAGGCRKAPGSAPGDVDGGRFTLQPAHSCRPTAHNSQQTRLGAAAGPPTWPTTLLRRRRWNSWRSGG